MTSIDDLFRGRSAPTSNPLLTNKRKHDGASTRDGSSELHKASRVNGKSPRAPQASVSAEEADDDDDVEAGPALPGAEDDDDEDEEEQQAEDEEGRFFGSGVANQTRTALEYLNDDGDDNNGQPYTAEKLDSAWLQRKVQSLTSRVAKNSEQRAKYESQPEKFMESEAALDDEVRALSLLSEAPDLYRQFAKLGGVEQLVGLLAHENTDIAIGAIQVLSELTDDDVILDATQWDALVKAALEADVVALLSGNLARLDEDGEDAEGDRSGVYHTLSLVENLASQNKAAEAVVSEGSILPWLAQRIQKQEKVGQNKQYAAEVLAILMQASPANRAYALGSDRKDDLVDVLLQLLAPYRKRDPERNSDEEEFLENIFDSLTCLVDEVQGKTLFLAAEGVELAVIMLREATHFSRPRALRLLDHATSGNTSLEVVQIGERFVDSAGLKPLFSMFAKAARGDSQSGASSENTQNVEHILGILASMLRLLPNHGHHRLRLLLKFVEGSEDKRYQHLARLANIRRTSQARLQPVQGVVAAERKAFDAAGDGSAAERAEMEENWLSRRLDAGLSLCQTVDTVIAWLASEDDGASSELERLLEIDSQSLKSIRSTLQQQIDDIQSQPGSNTDFTDMLTTLIHCLDAKGAAAT